MYFREHKAISGAHRKEKKMLAPLLVPACLLVSAASAQFGPPQASGCALIIPGPPKSSLFDHTNQVFGGRPAPFDAQNTCITYEAVNAAFLSARDRVGLPPVRGKFKGIDVGNLGTVIHETARYLAKQYALSKDAIANGLPLIDTTKTVIEPYCPPFLMTPKCEIQRYRSTEGICNNLEHPHWGAAMNAHHRWLAPDYADGISAPRASVTGYPLPSARVVSSAMHRDEGFHDHAVTILLVAWGQFIDHDITLTAETKDPRSGKTPKCCDGGLEAQHPNCLPIEIPHNDNFYQLHKRKCMNFVRTEAGLRYNCRLGPREQFNEISSVLDAGTVYSNIPEKMESLRLYKKGFLKTLPVFSEFNMRDLLPLKLEEPDEGCIRPSNESSTIVGRIIIISCYQARMSTVSWPGTPESTSRPSWPWSTLSSSGNTTGSLLSWARSILTGTTRPSSRCGSQAYLLLDNWIKSQFPLRKPVTSQPLWSNTSRSTSSCRWCSVRR